MTVKDVKDVLEELDALQAWARKKRDNCKEESEDYAKFDRVAQIIGGGIEFTESLRVDMSFYLDEE